MRTDDCPQGIFREELYAIAFKSHPLQNPIIGWLADLKSITRDDVYTYYKTFYTPNNATLVLVGDFQTDEMMKKVKKYFGKILRGPEVPRVTSIEIDQTNVREFTIERPDVKAASLTIAFHGPALGDPDCAPLFLARQVMTGFRFSRLNKRIIHDLKLARQVSFRIDRGKDPGLIRFDIQAFAGEPDRLDHAKEIVFEEIERMQNELIDEYELQKIRNNQKYDEIFRNMKISSIASRLSTYETYHTWKYIDEWYRQLETITREDIRRVMKKYFDPDQATYGYLLPGEAEADEKPAAQAKKKVVETDEEATSSEDARADPADMEIKDLKKDIIPPQPFAQRIKTATLNNGIEDHTFPIISLRGFIDTGVMPEERETPGVATVMGSLLNRGTVNRDYEQLSEYKEFIPLGFGFSAGNGTISLGGSSLTSRLGESIRDKQGLAYGVGCNSRTREAGGIWWIQSKTEPQNVPQLIRSAFQVMQDMKQNGVTDKELLNAKSYLLRTLPMVIETPLDLDGLFSEIIRTNSPLNSFDSYLERLIKIDQATVNALCRKYLDTDNYVIVVAGDVEENILDEFK